MNKLFLIVGIIIFLIVTGIITIYITKMIFQKVGGDVTGQVVGNLTSDVVGSLTGGPSKKIEKKPCTLPKHQREFKNEPYYSGPLIDSHVHLPTLAKLVSAIAGQNGLELPVLEGSLSAGKLICLFESEGITKTFGFHITAKFAEGTGVDAAKQIERVYPGKIIHFIMPPPVKSLNVEPDGIGGILNKNRGLFGGFGEIGLYMDGYEGAKPNDPDFLEIYKLADEHNLIMMIHPEDNLKDGIEEILQAFPNVTFFFHGGRNQEWVIDLMPKYKNFYYSVDADLVNLYGYGGGQQFKKSDSREDYLNYMRKNFNSNLEQAVGYWKARLEAHPDRFTWGTDRWFAWHFDPEVGGMIEEFGRSFIGRLDPRIQENFAYKNAEKMLQNR